jgi:NTE family protein
VAGSALVLGGGGVTGIAWELGMLSGLFEAGLDLTTADLVVGSSAGSVVAAQITTVDSLESLYLRQIEGFGSEIAAQMSLATLAKLGFAALRTRDEQRALANIGAMAVAAHTVEEAQRRAVIADRLPVHTWPDRRLLVTAVAADSGEFTVFDRDSGVALVDAVTASCAVPGVWPPITINGRRYIDGGVRSPANVDLVAGYDRVVVIAPMTASVRRRATPAAQVAALPPMTRTLLITPDDAAKKAIGRNVLDPLRRAPAAKAGRRQSLDLIAAVERVWSD